MQLFFKLDLYLFKKNILCWIQKGLQAQRLTFHEEAVHGPVGHPELVGCHQSVVAIIVVSWVLKIEASFYIIKVSFHVRANIFCVVNFLKEDNQKKPVSSRQLTFFKIFPFLKC